MTLQSAPPFYYNYENQATSQVCPSTVHTQNTQLHRFYTRYLLQKALSVFDWTLPEEWDKSYFLYVLYSMGYISILNTDEYGVIPQICGLRDYDIYYRPAYIQVYNPLLRSEGYILRINEECSLVKLQPDYGSIMDLVLYYADLMSLASEAISMNLVNSKLSYVFAGSNQREVNSLKKMFDNIAQGEPAVFIDKELMRDDGKPAWQMFDQNVGNNYIGTDVLNDLQSIECKFATEIGIPNNNFEKKERLIVDEVNSNNVETSTRCELWLDEIRKGLNRANELFGLNLKVDWRYNPTEGVDNNESNINDNRNV